MIASSHQTVVIPVADASAVGQARRAAVALADKLGFDATERGELALIVTEASTNLLQHAKRGELLLRAFGDDVGCLEIMTLDRGPGMADVAQCLRDGYSTGGSRGVGLGSIARLADRFDVHSREGSGTALLATCFAGKRAPRHLADLGAVCVAYPGEEIVGDAWSVDEQEGRTTVLVVDGIGHGLPAADSALTAVRRFEAHESKEPAAVLTAIHRALHGMRGAAGAVISIDWRSGQIRYCGVGNIYGSLVSDERSRGLSSHNGILGQGSPRFQEFHYEWPQDGLLVLHSDGISTRWSLESIPGLRAAAPSIIAGVLYRDFQRRDDVTALVIRAGQGAPP